MPRTTAPRGQPGPFPVSRWSTSRTTWARPAGTARHARPRRPTVPSGDDDTWWVPGALAPAADLLDACPSLASVTGRILVEPGGTEDPITPELRHSPVPGPPWLPGP